MVRAVRRVPPECAPRAWVLELHARTATLYALAGHSGDDAGRERLLSCGAALTNLRLAVRRLGWSAPVRLPRDPAHPDEVALVRAGSRRAPSERECADYAVIDAVHRQHKGTAGGPVDQAALTEVLAGTWWPGAALRPLADATEVGALAELVVHAQGRLDSDHRMRRELAPWTATERRPVAPGGAPLPAPDAVPAADAHCAACAAVRRRIAAESVLVAVTVDDGPRDQLLAGAAVQSARLTAMRRDLVLTPVTALLRLPEVRAELVERLALPGFPQALLRVGHPQPPHWWES